VIVRDTAEALRREAAEGRKIAAAAAAAENVGTGRRRRLSRVDTPSRRKYWVEILTADPASADILASLPDELAVPLSEVGHGQNPDPGADLTEPAAWSH